MSATYARIGIDAPEGAASSRSWPYNHAWGIDR